MSRIKVFFIQPNMTLGGAERQALTLMKGLDRERFEPGLVCLSIKGTFYEQAAASGIPTWFLGIRGSLPVAGFTSLVRLLRREKPEIVVLRGFSATALGRIAARFAGCPVVVVSEHSSRELLYRSAFKRAIDRALQPLTTLWIAVSPAQLPYLTQDRRIPLDRIFVIENGIEDLPFACRSEARTALGFGGADFVIGTVAAMRPEKDLVTFVEAARLIANRLPHARFVVVGDGPTRDVVEEAIQETGLSHLFTLLGSRSDVENILPALDVFTLASFSETAPLSVLEAMNCGLPVVGTEVEGLVRMVAVGETGLLVPTRDPSALQDAWATLANDSDLRHRMGVAGRKRQQERFSAGSSTREYEELFITALGGSDG